MDQNDMHLLFQQMGEVLSGIRGLHETARIRQTQAEQLHELVRSDMATLRRDHHDLEEKLDFVMCLAQHDIEGLRAGSAQNARSTDTLVRSVDALRRPIADIIALKSRVVALLFVAGLIGSGALWLAEPLYRWFVEIALQHRP